MKFNVKKLTINKKASKISLENGDLSTSELTALYILLGGYNEKGRNININIFHKLEEKFYDIIREIRYYM